MVKINFGENGQGPKCVPHIPRFKLKRKTFILLACIITIFSSCNKPEKAVHPNIILMLTDDQGWGDLSISGNTNIETPNINRLAETGVTFDRFYVSPVCSPTRAELLTGRYHPRGGVYSTSTGGERLDLDETTIADFFKKAGYATAAYGKWHNGMQPPYHPNARGFDDFYGFCSGHWGNYFSPMLEHNGEIVKGNGFVVDDFTNRGMAFMEQNKQKPFFLYMAYNTPHSPMQVPDRWWNKFENKELEMLHREPEKEDIPFTRAALAMCENIDWNVGRIVKKIEELGLAENTIIIYLSDNGPNSWRWNGGMKGRKGSTDEGGVRVPMFIKWEGVLSPGKKIEEIAGAIDLLPTLADLTGIEFQPEKPLDGVSLKPLLTETNPTWKERLIYSFWAGRTSVRNQQFRLDHEGKLFHMVNDPGQTKIVNKEYQNIANQMIQAKETWEKEVLSELPEEDNRTFTIGHPDYQFTQIPARDGTAHGNIQRSNRWPNDSFFTNWKSTSDSIIWETEVLADGVFEVEIYYTCPPEDVGSVFELSFSGEKLTGKITDAHNPPLTGMEHDRVERMESYVKGFKSMKLGTIHLKKGEGILTLKAIEIPGAQVMDFRLLMLKRI
jgi:arylsulfatase A-like enzyme